MDDDIRRQIGQLFGDDPEPPRLSKSELLTLKLRTAREAETRRIAGQDQAVQQIRALAEAAGIEVHVSVPSSSLRLKMARASKRTR